MRKAYSCQAFGQPNKHMVDQSLKFWWKILRIGGFENLSFFFLSQPFWLFFQKKYFLASSPSKSCKNYGVEWMGLNFYDNRGFQPKTTHPKHSWRECKYLSPKSFNFNISIPLSKDKKGQQVPFMALY